MRFKKPLQIRTGKDDSAATSIEGNFPLANPGADREGADPWQRTGFLNIKLVGLGRCSHTFSLRRSGDDGAALYAKFLKNSYKAALYD